ncbi:hypothetical protein JVU11DRAFT_8787 [Chiua virens]|nr:hypothetical protein JVU11DRAFT_8787 [Chiua virens]
MGKQIQKQHKKPVKAYTRDVPNEAINVCEASYEAADGNKCKADIDCYDDTRLMALICPLSFANINSPGEEQKYMIALITHLFSSLPPKATVVILYDIGCVLHRMLSKATAVGKEMCDDLGDWINWHLWCNLQGHEDTAHKQIEES